MQMKQNKMRLFVTVVGFFIFSAATAQNFKKADKYINHICKQQQNIQKSFLKYNKSLFKIKTAKADKKLAAKYADLTDCIKNVQADIDSMPGFKKDSSYLDSSLAYLERYSSLVGENNTRFKNILATKEPAFDNMQQLFVEKEKTDDAMKKLNEHFFVLIDKFDSVYKVKPKKQYAHDGKMAHAVEVAVYFKPVYLLFYKCYVSESDLQNAIQRKDITDFNKAKKDLLKYAEDGENKLENMQPFGNNNSLITGCKAILAFYDKEADAKADVIADYFSEAKDFEEARTAFNKKQKHTAPEIKEYKKPVSEFNKALKKYNAVMSDIYKRKKTALKKWYSISDSFIDKNMPSL
jgi:hypothetical protein